MPVLRRGIAISLISGAILACQHRAKVAAVGGGCETLPPQGAPGHADVSRSTIVDSQLLARHAGRLVLSVNWSSDSLAKSSHPRAVVRVVLAATNTYLTRVVDSSGVLPLDLPAAKEPYAFAFRLIGVQILDAPIAVRPGFTDSARVFLQAGGVTLCA